ncbi:MAG: hypothetical protein QM726_20655 [Chitinophagaceae bacterium]
MKRNISLVVLVCEIAIIIVLHAVKAYQPQAQKQDLNTNISKAKGEMPLVKQHYTSFLSIK